MSAGRQALLAAIAQTMRRREFLAIGASLGAVAAMPLARMADHAAAPASPAARLDDWTIDDMWGVYPRYAETIRYPRRHGDETVSVARSAPVDRDWVA